MTCSQTRSLTDSVIDHDDSPNQLLTFESPTPTHIHARGDDTQTNPRNTHQRCMRSRPASHQASICLLGISLLHSPLRLRVLFSFSTQETQETGKIPLRISCDSAAPLRASVARRPQAAAAAVAYLKNSQTASGALDFRSAPLPYAQSAGLAETKKETHDVHFSKGHLSGFTVSSFR